MGQQYGAEKASHGGDRKSYQQKSSGQNDHLIEKEKTRQRIANENHVSESFVRRSEYFAQGVDAAEEVEPGIKQEILRKGPLWSSSSGRPKNPKTPKRSPKTTKSPKKNPKKRPKRSPKKSRNVSAVLQKPCKPSGISQKICCSPTGKSTQTISAMNWKMPWTT